MTFFLLLIRVYFYLNRLFYRLGIQCLYIFLIEVIPMVQLSDTMMNTLTVFSGAREYNYR